MILVRSKYYVCYTVAVVWNLSAILSRLYLSFVLLYFLLCFCLPSHTVLLNFFISAILIASFRQNSPIQFYAEQNFNGNSVTRWDQLYYIRNPKRIKK